MGGISPIKLIVVAAPAAAWITVAALQVRRGFRWEVARPLLSIARVAGPWLAAFAVTVCAAIAMLWLDYG